MNELRWFLRQNLKILQGSCIHASAKTLKKTGLKRLFITSAEENLLALIKDELENNVIAERVGLTEQQSRVLKVLEKYGLIFRRSHGTKRLNRLTPPGMALALKIQQKVNVIADIFGSK